MLWLLLALLSYFLLAFAILGDKFLITGLHSSKLYAFYGGALGLLVMVFIPFAGLALDDTLPIIMALLAGLLQVSAVLGLYEALNRYEASRVAPAIGGFLPIFTLLLTLFLTGGFLSRGALLSFPLLVLGSILITHAPKKKEVPREYPFVFQTSTGKQSPGSSGTALPLTITTAILYALSFVLVKQVYEHIGFLPGLIWFGIGGSLGATFLLFDPEVRRTVFGRSLSFLKQRVLLYFVTRASGGLAALFLHWSIALAGVAMVAVINALQGFQYAALFLATLLLSRFYPSFIKEQISRRIILQKTAAIVLIAAGLVILTTWNSAV